jgi:FlaA1/EpsC-like NDP-sugar epimerase
MNNSIVEKIGELPRLRKRMVLIVFDVLALSLALWASFSLRYGNWSPPNTLDQFLIIATAPAVALPIFVRLGLYRAVIRYLPERALWTILQATTLSAVCWVVVIFLSEMAGRGVVPRSVPILYWAIATMLIGSSRFLAKKILWSASGPHIKDRPLVIYGAGESGAQLVSALRRQGRHRIVGFVDDHTSLQGRDVAGIRVFSPSSFPHLVAQYGVEEVILSIPSLTTKRRQEIVSAVATHGIKLRTVPPMSDLVSGKYLISQIREIDIDELLGRSSVPPDPNLLRQMIEGKTIMVTGAGGSIGSELCRLVVKWGPQRILLFEANEFALYQIDRELSSDTDLAVVPILGSVGDRDAVESAIRQYQVDVLFHAAAHKHVPLVEANALEGIRNNIFGTKMVVDIAFELGVGSFVLISSDKAVRPTNVMGATKRWAEFIVEQKAFEAATRGSGQRFSAVRFGNVLGSNGSVVPLFQEQIRQGGPVTLTDAAMTRYFMSIHEAAELIVQAGALSKGGDIFLLDMGEPVLIQTLAENMVRLAGLALRDGSNPDGDIEIVVTGKRPGEKMYEELFYDHDNAETTIHPKIMRAPSFEAGKHGINDALELMAQALSDRNEALARSVLFSVIQNEGTDGFAPAIAAVTKHG